MLAGYVRNFKPMEILPEEALDALHRATLDVLRETGVRFESAWALEFLEKNGCKVDRTLNRVRFPEGLVEECLRRAPSSFRIKARNPKYDVVFGGNTVYFSASAGMNTIDLDTFEPRPPTKAEHIDLVRVLNGLSTVHFLLAYPYFGFQGVPPVMAIPETTALKALHSNKIHDTACNLDSEIFNIRIAQAVSAEIVGALAASAPMTWHDNMVMAGRRMTEADFPCVMYNGAVYGGSGPATHAGSVVTGNAEFLSMLVLLQLLKPGHRVLPANFSHPMNMQSGSPAFCEIGAALVQAMFNQMYRRYGLPMGSGAAAMPLAKKMDFQAGYEKSIAAVLSAVTGAHAIALHGSVSSELTMHPLQAILDEDIAGMVGRFLEGETVNPETIALDLIHEVGPTPGNYLTAAHTRKWWKPMEYKPRAADQLTYPEWMRAGKKSALDYARERMEEILATQKVDPPLTTGQEQAVEDILKEAREFYRKKGMISGDEWEAYRQVW